MARQKSDRRWFMALLEAVLAESTPQDVLTFDQMARALKMTPRNFKISYVDQHKKLPIQKRGAEGSPYEFRVQKVLRFLIKITQAEIDAQDAVARRALDLQNIVVPENGGAPVSLAEMKRLLDIQEQFEKLKRAQRETLERGPTLTALEQFVDSAKLVFVDVAQQADPTGQWPPQVRANVEETMRNGLIRLQEEGRKLVSKLQ